MRKFSFKIVAFVAFLGLLSCEGVFILDPIDPRLPKYTHNGNDVAGAFVNNEQWKSVVSWGFYGAIDQPLFNSFSNDSLTITFYGDLKSREGVSFQFSLNGYDVYNLSDILKLKGLKIPIDGVANSALISDSDYSESCFEVKAVKGQLYTRDISLDKNGAIIFSGTFGFISEDSGCGPFQVSYGRFDYVIDDSNFRIY